MIRAYDDWGNVIDVVEHDKKVREDTIDELVSWIKHEEAEGKIHSLDDYDRIAEYLKEAGAKWQG